jgi:hypothetical protein
MMQTISGLLGIGAMLLSLTCHAGTDNAATPRNWKTECIGRYQVSVPGEVEVAIDKLTHKWAEPDPSFSDWQPARFSQLHYAGNTNVVSPAMETDFVKQKNTIIKNREETKKEFLKSSYENQQRWGSEMKGIAYDTPTLFGWGSEDNSPSLYYFLDNKIFFFNLTNNDGDDKALIKKYFESILNGFRPRPLYELPKQQGVCIPYGFIADDGTAPRFIAVTMRLLDHPDVEIGFRDQSHSESITHLDKDQYADILGSHGVVNVDHNEPKNAINDFFPEVVYADEKVKANFMGLHAANMGGQKGGAIFVNITRADGSPDYGYVIAVKGDGTAKTDTPSQLLYVIRTASRAKGKPVSKDELKDMAEKIVASVKRHPVQ